MAASLALGVLLGALLAGPDAGSSGIVVESVVAGSAAEKAGLAPGDRVTSWSQGPDSGPVSSPFDLEDVEIERAPRGPVSLSVVRGGDSRLVSLGEDAWGIRARPELPEPDLPILETARAASLEGRHEEAARSLAGLANNTTDTRVASWLHVESASAWGADKRWEEAQSQYEAALAGLGPRDAAAVWVKRGEAHQAATSTSGVKHAYAEARRLLESDGERSLRYAATLRLWTSIWPWPPEGVEIAHRASSLAEALAPESLLLSTLWINEGTMNQLAGDLDRTASLYERAHALQRRKAPGTRLEAVSLMNIGVIASERGDQATAEGNLRIAIRILDSAAGDDGFTRAMAYLNLGAILGERGDLDAARDATERCLEIASDLPGRSPLLPMALSNLGELAAERGDLLRAEELLSKALSLCESMEGDSRCLQGPLSILGRLALARGDPDRAEGSFRRLMSAQGSGGMTATRMGLGDVARARGDLAAAAALYQEVADAHSQWRPGSFQEAEALGRLASLQAEAGRTADAAMLYARAVEALELQRQTLGPGQEHGARRMADYSRIYAEYVDVLLSLRQPEEAFRIVEASRARALVELLARRDFDFAAEIPPELDRERRRIKASYDRLLAELDQVDAKSDPEGAEKLAAQLRDLQQARLRIAAEIRQASPRLAEIDNPRPVSVPEARGALDAGTLLLSYLVGERKTALFAVEADGGGPRRPAGVATFEIGAGRKELSERTGAFLALLRDRSADPAEITAAAQGLYRLLIAPAESLVSASSRLLISPDGPLQALPFAALAKPMAPGRPSRFLAERLPIHSVASATLYAELRQRRAAQDGASSVAAFGDPVYPMGPRVADEVVLRSGVRGPSLSPLPGTGREVREIARLFPRHSRAFLGPEATEENAKALSAGTRYVHFGCHALLNARSPLDSGLVLSLPEAPSEGRDNGILQAWEIFEDLRLDADIVTLSACESGLGAELAGEGLIGLTRAFQYAGARSVLASLWNVADDSTAELMAVFYRNLKEGKPKDEALQEAQVTMIRRGYAPFHWAAFQLTGDYR